jgi:hypothetical protein
MMDGEAPAQGLQSLLAAAEGDRLPPVEQWDPPHCGDIGMAIRADGTWFYQGSPIGRQRLVKLFSRILRREPDGSFVLVTPVEKVVVDVADAPFMAVELEVRGDGADQSLLFRTNVDDVVACDADHRLRFVEDTETGGLTPYLHVRRGLEAKVTRALMYDLVELAMPRANDGADVVNDALGVWSGGVWFEINAPVA